MRVVELFRRSLLFSVRGQECALSRFFKDRFFCDLAQRLCGLLPYRIMVMTEAPFPPRMMCRLRIYILRCWCIVNGILFLRNPLHVLLFILYNGSVNPLFTYKKNGASSSMSWPCRDFMACVDYVIPRISLMKRKLSLECACYDPENMDCQYVAVSLRALGFLPFLNGSVISL